MSPTEPSLTFEELIGSLNDSERQFIAGLDYGIDREKHREQLDLVIEQRGRVDMKTQSWFPYEVIELGKNHLQEGHEREFTACLAIVLKNIHEGNDLSNEPDQLFDNPYADISRLPGNLKTIIDRLLEAILEKG